MEANLNNESCGDYNWDEISVVRSHPEHERLSENPQQGVENHPNGNNHGLDANPTRQDGQEAAAVTSAQSSTAANNPQRRPLAQNQPINSNVKDFNVVRYNKIYEEKKKFRLAQEEERQRKQRQFQSHKAPNFQAIHATAQRKLQQQITKITCPVTPNVMKRQKETDERIKKQKEEYEASLRPKPFVSNADPDVLRKPAFVPQYDKALPIITIPFNLHTNDRLDKRRKFDEQTKAELEQKRLEEEAEKQRKDERERMELRKQTQFKAQPNPFK